MKKNKSSLFCVMLGLSILLFTINTAAQTNTDIKGKVLTENDRPVVGANIFIKDSEKGTTANHDGSFVIRNLKREKLILVVSCVGYESTEKEIFINGNPPAEIEITLRAKSYKINDVVITGTRTEKKLMDSPVRTNVINKEELRINGFTRLDNVLMEQAGLAIINDHGSGVQIQGLDPAYTLVLLDGEPVIGRTAGTLELSRFDVSSLKQIEIVKGPSSSLYGSEALAGVINLITQNPTKPFRASLKSLYGTYKTLDLSGSGEFIYDNINGSLQVNQRSSNGYDLDGATQSQTVPKYKTYTIDPKFEFKINEQSSIKLTGRVYLEKQNNRVEITEGEEKKLLNSENKLTDWNTSVIFQNKFTPSLKTEIKFYMTGYRTESKLAYQENGSNYDFSIFDQSLYKGEIFSNYVFDNENLSALGAGYTHEKVNADRIAERTKKTNSFFAFAQHEWLPSQIFDFVIGARFDHHSDYSSRLSPKFSFLIKPVETLNIRGSIGGGFKAPTLQQLYLDFTNPQVGYSVIGSSNFNNTFQKFLDEGQIDRILIEPSSINQIKAENSFAFNFGFEYTPVEYIEVTANLFRNNVRDLIDAVPIAVKNNGQNVYTYLNLNKIHTQGIESSIMVIPFNGFSISLGYQYLEAVDEDVLAQVKEGKISKVTSSGRVRNVTEEDYGGLFNRSKHSGTIRISYENNQLGISSCLSGILRGEYGYGDINGNGILDDSREYVPGYATWNLTLTKSVTENFSAQLRIENLFDKTNAEFIPSMPGRIIYAGLRIEFSKE